MSTTAPPPLPTYRWLSWLSVVVAFLGLVAFPLVMQTGYLGFPWYTLALGALGLLMAWYAWMKRSTTWRLVPVVLCLAILGLELWFIFSYSQVASYAGPLTVGKPVPAFQTQKSDGSAFTNTHLQGEMDTVLVFYRGLF